MMSCASVGPSDAGATGAGAGARCAKPVAGGSCVPRGRGAAAGGAAPNGLACAAEAPNGLAFTLAVDAPKGLGLAAAAAAGGGGLAGELPGSPEKAEPKLLGSGVGA